MVLKLCEIKKVPDGTYVAVKLSVKSRKQLGAMAKRLKIPNMLDPKEYHVTLVYSKKYLPHFKAEGKFDKPLIAKPTKFGAFGKENDCLVIELDCPELIKRNAQIVKHHGATSDFDSYKCHITLSYDMVDFDVDKIVPKSLKKIEFVEEYSENLNLDWSDDK